MEIQNYFARSNLPSGPPADHLSCHLSPRMSIEINFIASECQEMFYSLISENQQKGVKYCEFEILLTMYLCGHVAHAVPIQRCACEKQTATEKYAIKLVLPSPVAFLFRI